MFCLFEGHVFHVGGQAHGGEDFGAVGALDGDDGVVGVFVGDGDAFGGGFGQEADDFAGVGGVRDEEDVVFGSDVLDEVVDYAAAFVAAHCVLGFAGADFA